MFYLLYWVNDKTTSILQEEYIVSEKANFSQVVVGDTVRVKLGERFYNAKILHISPSREYLEVLKVSKVVDKNGECTLSVTDPSSKTEANKHNLKNNLDALSETSQTNFDSIENQNQKTDNDLLQNVEEENRTNHLNVQTNQIKVCNNSCECCKVRPLLDMLPSITPEILNKLKDLFIFCQAAQSVLGNSSSSSGPTQSSSKIDEWAFPSCKKTEIGHKGSGVWVNTQELAVAKSISGKYPKFGDKCLFRKLLVLTLGRETLKQLAYDRKSSKSIPEQLLNAIEEEANNEFHEEKDKKGHQYYVQTLNVYFCHIRAERKDLDEKKNPQKKRNAAEKDGQPQKKKDLPARFVNFLNPEEYADSSMMDSNFGDLKEPTSEFQLEFSEELEDEEYYPITKMIKVEPSDESPV